MIIGVTGGIGSGKSTVARMLGALGATVIDADAIAREIVEPGTDGLGALVEAFGPEILDDEGRLMRGVLAAQVFQDSGKTQQLNAIMHPRIAEVAQERIASAENEIVVYDMPLLFETGQQEFVDYVVVVDVPEEMQVDRAVHLRGLDRADVERRMQVQISRDQRIAAADFVIDNSGDLAHTEDGVRRLWQSIAT